MRTYAVVAEQDSSWIAPSFACSFKQTGRRVPNTFGGSICVLDNHDSILEFPILSFSSVLLFWVCNECPTPLEDRSAFSIIMIQSSNFLSSRFHANMYFVIVSNSQDTEAAVVAGPSHFRIVTPRRSSLRSWRVPCKLSSTVYKRVKAWDISFTRLLFLTFARRNVSKTRMYMERGIIQTSLWLGAP